MTTLIDIIGRQSEEHRVAIAGRTSVAERVGEAIVAHGEKSSVVRLVRNSNAEFDKATLEKLVERATRDAEIAADLRGRSDLDWKSLRGGNRQCREQGARGVERGQPGARSGSGRQGQCGGV